MLSQRQLDIMKYIHRYSAENSFAPSMREISLATGITSTSIVKYHIERLVSRGYLIKSPGKSRTLVLTNQAMALLDTHQAVKTLKHHREEHLQVTIADVCLHLDRSVQTLTPPVQDVTDSDMNRLYEENRLLRAENERLRREGKNRVAALQREIQYLSQELRQVQQSSERYPA